MSEFKSLTGDDIFSQEYKEKILKDYSKFYSLLREYKDDEYKDLIWFPDMKDIYKFDRKSNTNPIKFILHTQSLEEEDDREKLEHYRKLYKYDKKLNDNQMNYWELFYKIREQERKQVFDKSKELKTSIIENKNLLTLYKDNEIAEQNRLTKNTTTI